MHDAESSMMRMIAFDSNMNMQGSKVPMYGLWNQNVRFHHHTFRSNSTNVDYHLCPQIELNAQHIHPSY